MTDKDAAIDGPGRARRTFVRRFAAGLAGLGLAPGSLAAPAGDRRLEWPPAEDSEAFWDMVRKQYPVTDHRAYLNTGGLGPAPYPVLDALQRTILELQTISEHGHHYIEELREPVARFLGARPAEIAFMRNATEGNSTVASGLSLRPGDEVIFESHAHPGGAYPWMSRQKLDGIVVRIFEPDPTSPEGNLERIAELVTPRTRVIQVSHITAPTGLVMPVEMIARFARERGIWFHVDGAQSAGMIPVSLHAIDCDSYATSGHKWLGAPHGTGILYVREERLDDVRPTEVGSYSDGGNVHLPDQFSFNKSAQRYEPGTRDAASVVGLGAAVRFMEHIGMERVASRGRELAQYLQKGLRSVPGVEILTPTRENMAGSITTLRTDRLPYTALNAFYSDRADLRCRIVGERELNAVRVSTHIFNSFEECDRVVEATREALSETGSNGDR